MIRSTSPALLLFVFLVWTAAESRAGISVPFTYQGELTEAGEPANGNYDFRFQIFNFNRGDSQESTPRFIDDVSVVNGIFTVELDFNSRFESFTSLYLEIAVRPAGSDDYTTLSPRQPLHAALRSETALNVRDGSIDDDALANNAVRAANVDSSEVQLRVDGQCPANSAIQSIDDSGAVTCATASGGSWTLSGNAGTAPGTDFIGTSDDVPVDIRTNDRRAMRYEWGFSGSGGPNLIGGHANNAIPSDGESSVIAGGGVAAAPNSISASYGAIGGGIDNQVSASWGTIPGGSGNRVAGSRGFAAGQGAQALHDNSFVWNDGGTFASTGPDQFLIDAGGGVGIGTNNPSDLLHISAPDNTNAMRIQIGGQTRFRVHDNGGVSVGVNSDPPAGGLLVRGDVRREDPVTRYLQIGPGDWAPLSHFQEFSSYEYSFAINKNRANFVEATAPVRLPQGAVVTELRVAMRDQHADGNIQILLKRRENLTDALSGQTMAAVNSNGASFALQIDVDDSISFATVDNETYHYYLTFKSGTVNGQQQVFGARITYTTLSVAD